MPRPRHLARVICVGSMLLAAVGSALAQSASRTWTRPLSASVVATFVERDGALAMLLLWRGKPGWFVVGARSESGGGTGATIRGTVNYGDIRLEYEISPERARVQGRPVDLPAGANVLLIDGVDRPDGPTIAAIAGDLTTRDANPRLSSFLKQTPTALTFLRCGEPLTDDRLKPFNQFVCDDLGGK